MSLVLCTGIDLTLLQTRKLILERAGHIVVTATEDQDIEAACQSHMFSVAVIGQVGSSRMKRRFSELIRHNSPSATVLELFSADTGPTLPDADSWLQVPASVPDDLAKRVTELASGMKRKAEGI